MNIKIPKDDFIAQKFSTGWVVGMVKSGKEEECCWPVAVKYMSETHWWTQKLNSEDYGVDKCWVLLAVVKD